MNPKYLEKIAERANDGVSEKFGFSKFDQINIHLMKTVLNKNKHFWLAVNESNLSKFYESAIFAISVHFLEYNYCESRKILPEIGDKYQKERGRFKVIEICKLEGEEAVKLECFSPKKNCDALYTTKMSSFHSEYVKLDKKAEKSNRNTFAPMLNFIERTLGERENILSFPYKFAVVAQKNDFENSFNILDKKAFLYTYITKEGVENSNLESDDCMFYVASNYETIQDYIFDKGSKLESIVFIGNKYNHQIQQDINRNYFKQAIFVGEEKPDVRGFLKWRWILPEHQYFEKTQQTKIRTVKVENKELSQLTKQFMNELKAIETENYVDLSKLSAYISYAYPLVIPIRNSRLTNRIDDLKNSFEKKSKQVLGEQFDGDYTEDHQELNKIYNHILKQFHFENNAKTNALQQLAETDYLLAPKRQTLEVWKEELKEINWKKTNIISTTKLKGFKGQKSITILSLENYVFYCTIRGGGHNINWLLYDKEYEQYQNFSKRYDNALIKEYKSTDRKKLIGIAYPDDITPESADNLLDRIFDNKPPDDKEYQNSYQDHITKKVIFKDGSYIELSANSTLILINQHNESKKYNVGDLCVGDKVRVYKNQHKEVLFDIAADADKQGKFKEILDNAKLWKDILSQYCTDNDKIVEIANKCDIAEKTVRGWLDSNSNTMFPQNLGSLQDICGNDYQKIFISKKKYNSIMIALGRDLSDEISDYIISQSREKGKFLSEFKDEEIKAISEHNMPVKIIKRIEILDKE
ncbi:hypothetical protein [Candidatus Spongiihabitans sp.]|uniref:hypothetical protein n=1 Tax=Candidatus Spongiihabitans sp. TaxID=3101308 RepID=UPI003C6F837B